MKTKEELEHLKTNWESDPIWDIEMTEGFEEHKEELLKFRLEKEAAWKRDEERALLELAELFGAPGNLAMGRGLQRLMLRISSLENQLIMMRDRG